MKIIFLLVSIFWLLLIPITILDGFSEQEKLPDWIKNVFIWYGKGQITESEVLNAIKFLVENDIIKIESSGSDSMVGMMDSMSDAPFNVNAPITIPMIDGYYNGERVYFIHTEVSDKSMAYMMSMMINFPTIHVSELNDIAFKDLSKVYVFTNGVPGTGPFGGGPFLFQIDIFDSIPGQEEYSQFRVPHLVSWNEDSTPRVLTSVEEVLQATRNGELSITPTENVVNVPMIVWKSDDGEEQIETMVPRIFESMPGVKGELTFVDAKNFVAIFKLHSEKGMDMMETESTETMTVGGIDISMASPVEGNEDALITIIEFGDYQCVNCDKWFLNEKPTITNEFLDTGKAKMYFLDFPFQGPDSYTASEATWCANEQGKFAEFHDVLYVNQGGLEDGWASPNSLKQFASDIVLDTEQFNSCLDSSKFSEQVLYNKQVGILNGVDRTPVFFIVGSDDSIKRVDGNQPASVFQKVINDFINNQ